MAFVRKSVSITKAQDDFLKKKNLSLSKLLQDRLAEEMRAWKKARRMDNILRQMEQGNYEEMDMDQFLREARKWR